MKKNNEYPRYIPDIPMGEDWFEGKSHERLSKVIAQHIKDNDSAQEIVLPRLIGIEGSWGSGKSNVVELIKNSLNGSKYHFFEYDAWGNQEDLQRRSFLVQLTESLIYCKLLTDKTQIEVCGGDICEVSWSERIRYLLAHKRESKYETLPTINPGIVSILLAILLARLMPLLGSMIDVFPTWLQFFIPLAIPFVVWVCCVFRNRKKYLSWNFLFELYINEVRSEHSYETIYEEESSVIHFKKWMSDVSVELGKKEKKLVIVFDNMDRLPAEKVKQLWSSINTFFAGEGFRNIWVVVPFDRGHLSRVFPDSSNDGAENAGSSLAQHFIDKTFTITFDVPKPVISDYKGLFRSLYEKAFGTSDKEEIAISRLYRSRHKDPIVRNIIVFLNDLVTLYKTCESEMPILHMAIYLLNKNAIREDPINKILDGSYLTDTESLADGPDRVKTSIAALHYGVDTANAFQIPLKGYLSLCLESKEGYDINRYAEDKHFYDILVEVCAEAEDDKLPPLINMLNVLKSSYGTVSSIWDNIALRLLRIPIKEQPIPDYYLRLLSHVDKEKKDKLIQHWSEFVTKSEKLNGSEYVKSIIGIREACNGEVTIPLPEINVSPDVFVDAIGEANDEYATYNLIVEPEKVDEFFASQVSAGFCHYEYVSILVKGGFCEFSLLKHKLEDYIHAGMVDAKDLGQVFNTYRAISVTGEKLKEKLPLQRVTGLISELGSAHKRTLMHGYIDLLAMLMAYGGDNNTKIVDDQMSSVASIIDYYANADELLLSGSTNQNFTSFVTYVIIHKYGIMQDLSKVLPRYTDIKEKYNVNDEQLLGYLNKWHEQLPTDVTDSDLRKLIPNAKFYNVISSNNNELSRSIIRLALSVFFKSATCDALKRNVRNVRNAQISPLDKYLFQLICNLITEINKEDYPHFLLEFCKWLYMEFANGTFDVNDDTNKIMLSVDGKRISDVFSEIRDLFCNGKKSINPSKYKLMEENLRLYGELQDRKTDVVNKILKPVISDNDCKHLILENASFYKDIVEEAGNIDDFKKEIRSKWTEQECAMIGVSIV
ncbi:MAG: KAP family NTPase [Prevotellaceae bacterium]|nr:KAP family NTPase [Prevotellaceae bacterium]